MLSLVSTAPGTVASLRLSCSTAAQSEPVRHLIDLASSHFQRTPASCANGLAQFWRELNRGGGMVVWEDALVGLPD